MSTMQNNQNVRLICNQDGQLGNARTDLLPHQISKAKDQALEEYAQYDLWDDDVFCLDALRVEVV